MNEVTKEKTDRRQFLKLATTGLAAAVGIVVGFPLVRFFFHPLGKNIVSSSDGESDVGESAQFVKGGEPKRVTIVASDMKNAWGAQKDTAVGSAWVSRKQDGRLVAFSAVCPHLGCSIRFDGEQKHFACPCHDSSFADDGAKLHGPAKRGLDPLPVEEENGRVKLTFVRYRGDVAEREPV